MGWRAGPKVSSGGGRCLGRGDGELGPPLGEAFAAALALFLEAGGEELLVLGGLRLGLGDPFLLVRDTSPLPLQRQRRHQPLDLRRLATLLPCRLAKTPRNELPKAK